jgi:hypothetical protein
MMSTHSDDGRTDPKQAQLDAQRVEHPRPVAAAACGP